MPQDDVIYRKKAPDFSEMRAIMFQGVQKVTDNFFGNSPPQIFVGSKLKYPKVNVGILSPPEKVPECVLCVEDTQNARAEIIANKKHKTVIELKCNCCNSCIWWDWFHQKRELYAVQNGVKFKYTKKCTERVP